MSCSLVRATELDTFTQKTPACAFAQRLRQVHLQQAVGIEGEYNGCPLGLPSK